MQISLSKGVAHVRLTMREAKTICDARDIVAGLAKFDDSQASTAEQLRLLIQCIGDDGVFEPPKPCTEESQLVEVEDDEE